MLATYLLSFRKYCQEQFKKEKIYFSSQFKGTVFHDREIVWGFEVDGDIAATVRGQRALNAGFS